VLAVFIAGLALPALHSSGHYSQLGNASSYSPERAALFAHFSNAAYCSSASLANWSCAPCLAADPAFRAKVFGNASTATQCFVGMAPGNDIVVAFRGTDCGDPHAPGNTCWQNWVTNLNFPKSTAYPKCDGCEVHSGFYQAWLSVKEAVVAEVKRLHEHRPSARIFVTGHSMGGSVGEHCAAELGASRESLGYPVDGVYTYGSPRVGNSQFARFYGEVTRVSWRVTHWRDLVPHLPPSDFGFQHTATEVFYVEDGSSYTICDSSGEDPKCSMEHDLYSVEDHYHYMQPPLTNEISLCP